MQKSIIILFLMSMPILAQQAECVISGPSEVLEGGTYEYTVNANAQCTNCHDWDIVNPTALDIQIVNPTDDQESTVMIYSGSGPGSFTLRLTYFDETGCHTCEYDVIVNEDVVDPCEINPEIQGKLFCSEPQNRRGDVLLSTNMDPGELATIESVTWTFNPLNNNGYYTGFEFSNGTTTIVSTDSASNFQEAFTFIGICEPDNLICFDIIVKFNNGCEAQQYIVCENLEADAPEIGVFPNPANNTFNVTLENLNRKTVNLELYNLSGKLLKTEFIEVVNGNDFKLPVSIPITNDKMIILKVIESGKIIDTKRIMLK